MPRKFRYSPLTSAQHVVRKETPKELNTRRCPVCGAKKGEVCFVLTATRFIELKTTHLTKAKGTPPAQRRPRAQDDVPMALDVTLDGVPRKTSTATLDREYAWKKARLAAGERRRNGG